MKILIDLLSFSLSPSADIFNFNLYEIYLEKNQEKINLQRVPIVINTYTYTQDNEQVLSIDFENYHKPLLEPRKIIRPQETTNKRKKYASIVEVRFQTYNTCRAGP